MVAIYTISNINGSGRLDMNISDPQIVSIIQPHMGEVRLTSAWRVVMLSWVTEAIPQIADIGAYKRRWRCILGPSLH